MTLNSDTLESLSGLPADQQKVVLDAFQALLLVAQNQREQKLESLSLPEEAEQLVERLIDIDPAIVSGLAADASPDAIAVPAAFRGERFGNWEILDTLGRGGMGEVYAAKRVAGGPEQIGALKVLSPARKTERARRLFEREQLYLGMLGRCIEAGELDDRRKYHVTEYASEGPLLAYCNKRSISIRKRVEFFCELCEIVEHIHRVDLIHGDIKPDNVLVSADGRVHLIDFSIAILREDSALEGLHAAVGYSSAYASPEQLADTRRVSSRSDIYMLGVLFEELLIGELSSGNATSDSWVDLSSRLEGVTDSDTVVVERGSTVNQLEKDFTSRIDKILVRAKSAGDADRYWSVFALQRDALKFMFTLPNPDLESLDLWRRVWRRHPVVLLIATVGCFLLGTAAGAALF